MLPDGVHVFTATAGNLAGYTSLMSDALGIEVDTVAPTATIDQSSGQPDPANSQPILFDVHFSKPVIGFTGSDVSFNGSTVGGSLLAAISGTGADYTVSVTGMEGTGTVVASIPAGAVTDIAGNNNITSTSTDNSVTFDGIPPSVAINPASGQPDPAFASPVVFQVTFSEPVTGFDSTDVDLSSSSVAGTLVANVSGSGANYTISVTGMFGVGTVVATIPAGAAIDGVGNLSAQSYRQQRRQLQRCRPTPV